MNVLVTGATGAVGPRLVRLLEEKQFKVRAFALRAGGLPESVDLRIGDIKDIDALTQACQSIDIVFHLAALLHIVNPSDDLEREYQRVNVDGTANVIRAALGAGVQRLVFFSTIAVYGPTSGVEVDESSTVQPDSFYSRSKVAAEELVLSAKRPDGSPLGTVLRLGAVYGAGVKGNYDRLVHALARGRFVSVGAGRNRRTLVHEDDVAEAALLAATHPAAAGEVFNITDGTTHEVREIIAAISEALGRRPPRMTLPVAPIRLVLGVADAVSSLTGIRFPAGRVTLAKYLEDVTISGEKAQRLLGFRPSTRIDQGWKKTIEKMGLTNF